MLIRDLNLIGENLYNARKKIGLTQWEAAERAKLSDRTYAEIERGNTNMRIETFIQICEALHVMPNEILVKDNVTSVYDEEELINRLNMCEPKEQNLIFQILTIYLDSINK